MNDDLELALAYWRTMAPQPKAMVYANAIEARLKGIETKGMVIDHELENAIKRGASIARAKGVKAESTKTSQPAVATASQEDKPKAKRGRKSKTEAATTTTA